MPTYGSGPFGAGSFGSGVILGGGTTYIYGHGGYGQGIYWSSNPQPPVPVFTSDTRVHAIFSSYFGDFEFDIGKTVRWAQYFTHTHYALDTDLGPGSRNWVLSWDKTFPEVKVSFSSDLVWHRDVAAAAAWRKLSFERADAAFGYADEDWVLFVDATEGLTFDSSANVADYAGVGPFYMWLLSEIEKAKTENRTQIALPFYAYVNSETVQYQPQVIDPVLSAELDTEYAAAIQLPAGIERDNKLRRISDLRTANTAVITYAIPRYVSLGKSPRLIRADVLRSGTFDWSSIDNYYTNLSPATVAGHTAIISYAYARWAVDPLDRNPDGTASSEATDVGWEMRRLVSQVRPVPMLQADDWYLTDAAVAGALPGPNLVTGTAGAVTSLRTPVYQNVFRYNPRDGLFYVDGDLGPVPWDLIHNKTSVDPYDWDHQPTGGGLQGTNRP